MTIGYRNGQTAEAIILTRTETAMRVILRGSDDVLALHLVSGTWVTEDCEPVTVEFARRRAHGAPLTEADCICPAELAAHLIHLLLAGSTEDPLETAASTEECNVMTASARVD